MARTGLTLLREELRQFERRSQRGSALKLGAGTGHDDMVMALALAGWWAYENKSRALSGPELKALDWGVTFQIAGSRMTTRGEIDLLVARQMAVGHGVSGHGSRRASRPAFSSLHESAILIAPKKVLK